MYFALSVILPPTACFYHPPSSPSFSSSSSLTSSGAPFSAVGAPSFSFLLFLAGSWYTCVCSAASAVLAVKWMETMSGVMDGLFVVLCCWSVWSDEDAAEGEEREVYEGMKSRKEGKGCDMGSESVVS